MMTSTQHDDGGVACAEAAPGAWVEVDATSQQTSDTSSSPPSLPAGFVCREEAARISGLGITAWNRRDAEGKVTCGQWMTLGGGGRHGGGRVRIYSIDGIERMMRDVDLTFPPPGTVDRHEAARMFGVSVGTFSVWERQGRITCGRLITIPGKAAQYKVYPLEELQRLAEDLRRLEQEAARQMEPYADADRPGIVRVPVFSDKHKGMEAIIDAEDLPLVRGKRWNWSMGMNRQMEYGAVIWSGVTTPLARMIKGVTDPDICVCHVNGDRLDYRRENLILRTRSQVKRTARRPLKWDGFIPYPDPDRPGIVRIPVLTDKHKGMEAIIDAADLPLIEGKRWHWSPSRSNGRSTGGSIVLAMTGTPKPSLPRILLRIDDPEQLVSHRNGDRLDCRRENLLVRTRAEVRRAAKKALGKGGKACSSRFKGVGRTGSGRKWQATINIGGEYRNLGRFYSEVDAARAYDAALRELMGPDAPVNLPDPAEAERLRALEPVIEMDATWPPPGMVDRHEACAMFGVAIRTWTVWERRGRITCGQYHRLPNDKPGQCKLYPKDDLELARIEIEKLGKPYADPDRPGVWRVPLKSYLAYREVLIDEADLPVVEGRNWNWNERIDEGRTEGIVILATTERQAPLHRMIAGVTDPTTYVSFVNGDALDCRRANLVVRTQAQTVHTNRKRQMTAGKECTSRFKGVSHDQKRGKWVAQIRRGEVHKGIGRFDDELAAAEAYDDCARVWFGDHAYVNFPDRASTEANRLWAQRVMDGTAAKERLRRRRLKKLERKLKLAAHEAWRAGNARTLAEREAMQAAADAVPMIRRSVARKLFGASRLVWNRWRRLGWLPNCVTVDGKKMYRLAEIERLLRRCGKVVLPYPDPERPGVYRVPLFGETAQGREALIDADAVPLVRQRRWRFAVATDIRRAGEVQTMNPSENIRLHKVVLGISGGELRIGFRNGDPLDCRRANLVARDQTHTNAGARKASTFRGRPCTSRFKGVYREKRRNRWVATIKKDRVQRRLGTFYDEIAAAQAYDEAARELFGEHARPNFPNGVDAWLENEAELVREENGKSDPVPDATPPALAHAA